MRHQSPRDMQGLSPSRIPERAEHVQEQSQTGQHSRPHGAVPALEGELLLGAHAPTHQSRHSARSSDRRRTATTPSAAAQHMTANPTALSLLMKASAVDLQGACAASGNPCEPALPRTPAACVGRQSIMPA